MHPNDLEQRAALRLAGLSSCPWVTVMVGLLQGEEQIYRHFTFKIGVPRFH